MKTKDLSSGRKRLSWPRTAINLAYEIARSRSQDPYLQVGAVAIKKDNSILVGYNGAPSGIEIDWSNRDERRAKVLHAEVNVLNYCKPNEVKFLASTHMPCPECVKIIAAKNIDLVFFAEYPENYPREFSFELAKEFGITLFDINNAAQALNN